jgi:hypothetical protein
VNPSQRPTTGLLAQVLLPAPPGYRVHPEVTAAALLGPEGREAAAWDRQTSATVLAAIASTATVSETRTWWLLAIHSNAPAEVLAVCARHPAAAVREETATNPNTPPEALAQLAADRDAAVAYAAAENPRTPFKAIPSILRGGPDDDLDPMTLPGATSCGLCGLYPIFNDEPHECSREYADD